MKEKLFLFSTKISTPLTRRTILTTAFSPEDFHQSRAIHEWTAGRWFLDPLNSTYEWNVFLSGEKNSTDVFGRDWKRGLHDWWNSWEIQWRTFHTHSFAQFCSSRDEKPFPRGFFPRIQFVTFSKSMVNNLTTSHRTVSRFQTSFLSPWFRRTKSNPRRDVEALID